MALMWLLADVWGRVTHGIRRELSLSHEALGGLIGARRPTVTLALTTLAERRALIRQDRVWLILDAPPARHRAALPVPPLGPTNPPGSPWRSRKRPAPDSQASPLRLTDLTPVREECMHNRQRAQRLRVTSTDLCKHSQQIANNIRAAVLRSARLRDAADRSRSRDPEHPHAARDSSGPADPRRPGAPFPTDRPR